VIAKVNNNQIRRENISPQNHRKLWRLLVFA